MGTLAPDFEYFLRLAPGGGFGHTFAGMFLQSLPLALLVLWIFHAVVKRPLIQLFPDGIRLRLAPEAPFRFGGFLRFLLIAVSALIGIGTHILWDSFTHSQTWPTRHWAFLRATTYLPALGWLPNYKVLQHTSGVFGILALCAWAFLWYRNTVPRHDGEAGMSARRRWLIATLIVSAACIGAIVRAIVMIGSKGLADHPEQVVIDCVVTALAVLWWLLVGYAALVRARRHVQSRVGV